MSIFEKIIAKEIPANIVHEDELCLCFHDIAPQAPVHLLVIPKAVIPRIAEAEKQHQSLLGHLMLTAQKVAQDMGFSENGYRLVVNNGPDGGEEIPHLHLHILAGRSMQWPPG